MNNKHLEQALNIYKDTLFAKPFDGMFLIFDEDTIETADGGEFVKSNLINDVQEAFNHSSWDGEMWWMDTELGSQFILFSKSYHKALKLKLEDGFEDENGNGISESLFYMHTPNGLFLLDTTYVDFGSHSVDLIEKFKVKNKIDDNRILNYGDSHLPTHLNFERVHDQPQEKDLLIKLIEEGVLSDNILWDSFDRIPQNKFKNIKKVFLNGKFSMSKDEIKEILKYTGLTVVDKLDSNCWIWNGKNPKLIKSENPQSTILEVCKEFFVKQNISNNVFSKEELKFKI